MDSSCLTSGDILLATRTTAAQQLSEPTCALMNIRADNSILESGEEHRGRRGKTTYPNSLIDQLTSFFQLLRGASDGEDAHIGVSVWRWVSL